MYHFLCSGEQSFFLTVLEMFQGCVPNKCVLFDVGTDYGFEPELTWLVASAIEIWPMKIVGKISKGIKRRILWLTPNGSD